MIVFCMKRAHVAHVRRVIHMAVHTGGCMRGLVLISWLLWICVHRAQDETKFMTDIRATLNQTFISAIKDLYPDLEVTKSVIEVATDEKFGDYKCLAAMTVTQVIILNLMSAL